MSNDIPNPETGAMDDDAAVASILAPAEEQPNETEETEAAQDAAEAEEAAPDENSDEPEGDPEEDEEAEESDPEDAEDVEYVTVKVDGEEIDVTLEEAIAGYSRTEHLNRKSRKLAEERKAMEAELTAQRAELEKERARYGASLQEEIEEPDWNKLREEDPIGYAEKWADFQRAKQAREKELAAFQAEEEQRIQKVVQETGLKALEVLPEWREAGAFTAGENVRNEAARALGFTDAEIAQNHDFRVFAMLEKAARYDALMAEKQSSTKKVLKKVKKAPVRMKPEARRTKTDADDEQARLEKLRRTGSDEAAVAYLFKG